MPVQEGVDKVRDSEVNPVYFGFLLIHFQQSKGLNLFPFVVVDRRSKRDKVVRFMSCFLVSSDDISAIGFQFITLSQINYSVETDSKQEKATIPLMPNIKYRIFYTVHILYMYLLHVDNNQLFHEYEINFRN